MAVACGVYCSCRAATGHHGQLGQTGTPAGPVLLTCRSVGAAQAAKVTLWAPMVSDRLSTKSACCMAGHATLCAHLCVHAGRQTQPYWMGPFGSSLLNLAAHGKMHPMYVSDVVVDYSVDAPANRCDHTHFRY
jgi:hypothetical protein